MNMAQIVLELIHTKALLRVVEEPRELFIMLFEVKFRMGKKHSYLTTVKKKKKFLNNNSCACLVDIYPENCVC